MPPKATSEAAVAAGKAGWRPKWVTPELVNDTLALWQPYYGGNLTEEDAVEILVAVGGVLDGISKSQHRGANCGSERH